MEWFIHNHDSIIKQWTLKALTVKPKASHTQHAPPGPQRSQRHWTFLNARRLPPSQSSPYFFVFSKFSAPSHVFSMFFFFNHLNIFWYKKNKPTYDESTMFVTCFSPVHLLLSSLLPRTLGSSCWTGGWTWHKPPESSLLLCALSLLTLVGKKQKTYYPRMTRG